MRERREDLAKRRRARGLSQEHLAERLNVDRSTIGRWERGETDPVPWVRPLLAEALQISLDELDCVLAVGDAVGVATSESVTSAVALRPAFFRDSARDALTLTSKFAIAVDATDVDALHARVGRVARSYLTDPLDVVVPEVQSIRTAAESLLSWYRPQRVSSDLLVVVARSIALLANAAMDIGEHSAAHDHAQAAVCLAELVGHPGIAAWARGLQASNAFWAGDPARSAAISAATFNGVSYGTTGVFLACLLARASGRVGDHGTAARALAWAERARDKANTDEVDGVFTFSEAKQNLYAATAYLGVGGNPARALDHAQRAVAWYTRTPTRSFGDESGARVDVATAYLRLGEPEGAIEALEPVLGLPASLRVASIRKRLERIRAELAVQHTDLPAARDTIERIADFQAGTLLV